MPEWKIANRKKIYKPEMRITQEKFLEEDLNEKIIADPRILEESFLLIGQQVLIPDTMKNWISWPLIGEETK